MDPYIVTRAEQEGWCDLCWEKYFPGDLVARDLPTEDDENPQPLRHEACMRLGVQEQE